MGLSGWIRFEMLHWGRSEMMESKEPNILLQLHFTGWATRSSNRVTAMEISKGNCWGQTSASIVVKSESSRSNTQQAMEHLGLWQARLGWKKPNGSPFLSIQPISDPYFYSSSK